MYRLITFGGLNVERDGVPMPTMAAQRKALALLAIVAAGGAAGVPRDRLLALLWPESDSDRARGALKQMLHSLRRQLGSDDVLTGTASLSLDPQHMDSDIAAFAVARRAGHPEDAVALYAGPFMDGVHVDGADELERWADGRRRELADDFAAALEELACAADARGDWTASVSWWRRRQAAEPLSSRVAVALMRALDSAGDGPAAMRHARVHESLVLEEFGSPPDPAVTALSAAIASGATARPAFAGRIIGPAPRVDAVAIDRGRVAEAAEAQRASPSAPRWRTAVRIGLGLAVAGAIAMILWRIPRDRRAVAALVPNAPVLALDPKRVAITVFENQTGDSALASLGLMASDWVTRGLARTTLVEVLDVGALYTQGHAPLNEPPDPRALARRSGAGLVVEGRYYRTADTVRFTASIVDVGTGRVLRVVDPIGAPVADPLAAVNELRQRVAAALGTIVDPRASYFVTPSMRPPRFEAYAEYVAAQDLYWRGAFAPALPHFRRAAELDPSFDAAAAWLTVNAVGIGRCDIVDSVAAALNARTATLGPWERTTISVSKARCASDWEEHNRLQRARLELQPGSSHVRWTLAVAYRQLRSPAPAISQLTAIDPARDLAWMSDDAKLLYWRELTADYHALGDYGCELAGAVRMTREGRAPLAAAYIRARALAGAGRATEALAALDHIDALPPEPALVAGATGAWMRAPELASPGWVMYQVATELAAHGATASTSRIAAARAVTWFTRRAKTVPLPSEQRFVLAHALVLLDRSGEGRAVLDTLVRAAPTGVELRGALGTMSAAAGDSMAARRTASWLAALPPRFPVGMPTLYRARIAALLGDAGGALELLEALPHGAHPYDIGMLHSDPAFRSLRDDPRFTRLVQPRK
ncbi:MAG: hypothetical protein M3Z05_09565 [Gemmatimonadota bacterium]|nr:hypothetical protein [Gemmatimonadota bacterium]